MSANVCQVLKQMACVGVLLNLLRYLVTVLGCVIVCEANTQLLIAATFSQR